jgi:hypothetical protein
MLKDNRAGTGGLQVGLKAQCLVRIQPGRRTIERCEELDDAFERLVGNGPRYRTEFFS